MSNAASARIARSSHVQPSSRINVEVPAIKCGRATGTDNAVRIPFDRATGINSLSGLSATCAWMLGFITPSSASSTVARTAVVSASPSRVQAAMRPG